jgi:large subunit ribosomal protein L18
VIDDMSRRTIVSASTLCTELRETLKSAGTVEAATQVGTLLARRALEAEVTKVVYDRSSYKYHGRVRALAEAARQGGLEF